MLAALSYLSNKKGGERKGKRGEGEERRGRMLNS